MSQNDNFASEAAQDEILSSILQKISSAPMQASPPQGNTGGGDILSSLLSNPELIAKLPSILSSVKPLLEILQASSKAAMPPPPKNEAVPVLSSDAPASATKHSPNADSRTALLCAMKPYLSRDRQNAIDYIVKIGRLGDILKTL